MPFCDLFVRRRYDTITSMFEVKFLEAESSGILKSGSIKNSRTVKVFALNSVACRVRFDCDILKIILHSMSFAGQNKSVLGVEDCSERGIQNQMWYRSSEAPLHRVRETGRWIEDELLRDRVTDWESECENGEEWCTVRDMSCNSQLSTSQIWHFEI